MLIVVIAINPDGTIVIKKISDSGEFPEQDPEVLKQYTVYFEGVEKDKVPEFNS